VKFRKDRPEESCPKAVPAHLEPFQVEAPVWACMRIAGHEGDCVPRAGLAALLDGVCHYCRNPLNQPHEPDCKAAPER